NEPARLAQLDDGDQRAVRCEGVEGSTQVVQLLHGVLHRFISAPMDAISSPPPAPIASPLEVFRRRPPMRAAPSISDRHPKTFTVAAVSRCSKTKLFYHLVSAQQGRRWNRDV